MKPPFSLWLTLLLVVSVNGYDNKNEKEESIWGTSTSTSVVKSEERRIFSLSENGMVSGVNVRVNGTSSYHLHFITMEPASLFLPVLLHSDMLFYVQSGSGNLSYFDEDEGKKISLDLQMGDVYGLKYGSVFFIQSNLNNQSQKLQICSIFATSNAEIREPSTGPYSSIHKMLLGFDQSILRAAFKVPDEVIEELRRGTQQPLIVHGLPKSTKTLLEAEADLITSLMIRKYNIFDIISNKKNKKDKKHKLFNFLRDDRDFENSNGWSTAVTSKKLKVLKHSNMGIFMVNLTKGSMMGPHWNPRATEIGIVVQGQGVVRMVCSNAEECESKSFRVKEGDVFVVPRFHPMAQMSFSNDTLVFVGFSTWSGNIHPQYLAGKSSVLQTLDKHVLAMSFNVPNTTIDKLLANQQESIILECTFCAELEERKIEEEEGKREEEVKRREEEEMRKKEEEEARKREWEEKQKEEERKKEEAEEARRQEEEKRRREAAEQAAEAARKREEAEAEARREEEEEARRWEEEKRRREEEAEQEAMREREAEAARKREEAEVEARREREAEEARQQEEEKRKREEEGEQEARQREETEAAMRSAAAEAEARRKKEEEESRSREAEAARRLEEEKRREEEAEQEAGKQKEAEAEAKREKEAEEEQARRQEEERKRREAEAARSEEAWRERMEEEARRQAEQAEAAKREKAEAEAKRWEEQEEAKRQEEWRKGQGQGQEGPRGGGGGGGEEAARKEEEAARQQEEERRWGEQGVFIKMW